MLSPLSLRYLELRMEKNRGHAEQFMHRISHDYVDQNIYILYRRRYSVVVPNADKVSESALERVVSPFSNVSLLPVLVPYCSLQVKLMKYICKQLQCKQKVPETERPEALDSYPHLRDWLRTINLRPELIQVRRCIALSSSVL